MQQIALSSAHHERELAFDVERAGADPTDHLLRRVDARAGRAVGHVPVRSHREMELVHLFDGQAIGRRGGRRWLNCARSLSLLKLDERGDLFNVLKP